MKISEEKRYEQLSPFELKNKLIKMAKTHHERMMLNAGRGNPNWVAITPRQAFFLLGKFAMAESLRVVDLPCIGGPCEKSGITQRFKQFLKNNQSEQGVNFLRKALDCVKKKLKIDEDDFITATVDRMIKDTIQKLSKIYKTQFFFLHVKRYEKQGKIKYSIRTRILTDKGTFISKSYAWDLRTAVDDALEKLERIMIKEKQWKKSKLKERLRFKKLSR